MRRATLRLHTVLLLALAAVSAGVTAQKQDASPGKSAATLPERIWRDSGDMASLDLIVWGRREGARAGPAGHVHVHQRGHARNEPEVRRRRWTGRRVESQTG